MKIIQKKLLTELMNSMNANLQSPILETLEIVHSKQ